MSRHVVSYRVLKFGHATSCRRRLFHALFQMLAGVVDAIIHSGASVNLVRSYQSLKAVNVLGTQVPTLPCLCTYRTNHTMLGCTIPCCVYHTMLCTALKYLYVLGFTSYIVLSTCCFVKLEKGL